MGSQRFPPAFAGPPRLLSSKYWTWIPVAAAAAGRPPGSAMYTSTQPSLSPWRLLHTPRYFGSPLDLCDARLSSVSVRKKASPRVPSWCAPARVVHGAAGCRLQESTLRTPSACHPAVVRNSSEGTGLRGVVACCSNPTSVRFSRVCRVLCCINPQWCSEPRNEHRHEA